MSPPEVIRKIRIRRRILMILVAAVLAAILIWLSAVIIAVILDYSRGGGTIETGPIMVE